MKRWTLRRSYLLFPLVAFALYFLIPDRPSYSFNGSIADLHASSKDYKGWLEERLNTWEDRLEPLPTREQIPLRSTLEELRESIESISTDNVGWAESSERLFSRLRRQYARIHSRRSTLAE